MYQRRESNWNQFSSNHILNKCRNDSHDFLPALANCLSTDPNFSLETFNQSLQYDRVQFADNLTLFYGEKESISLENLAGKVWSSNFHKIFGLCYTLDLSKEEKYRYVDIFKHDVAPALNFDFPKNNYQTWMTLLFHNEYDTPDAMRSHLCSIP